MRYYQTTKVHEQIESTFHLIETGKCPIPELAKKVGISIHTTSRIVATLWERRRSIHAERTKSCWHLEFDYSTKNGIDVHQTTECKSAAETQYQRY
jgi:hypothetical protein